MATDGLTIRFGIQSQTGVSASATGDIQFTSPSISYVVAVTTVATVPGPIPAAAVYRLNFNASNYFFPFILCGSGNVIVTFDDPEIQQLSGLNVVLQSFQPSDLFSYMGLSSGRSQTPIMVRRPDGALDSGQIVVWLLATVPNDNSALFNGWAPPNVDFNCTVYCY